MKRILLFSSAILAFTAGGSRASTTDPVPPTPPPAVKPEAEPLLKASDVKSLSKLFTDYFEARLDDDLKKMSKSYAALDKKLDSVAKSKKVESMLISPVDLRTVYGSPTRPEKSLKKGNFYKKDFTISVQARDAKYEYLLYLPKNYNHNASVPLILCLHPDMSRLDEVKKWAAKAYPSELAEKAIIVIPLNVGDAQTAWSTIDGRMLSFFSMRDVTMKYNVDRLKVFLDAHGGTALAATEYATGYPGMFTTVIFRGLVEMPPTENLANARNIPFVLLAAGGEGGGNDLLEEFAEEAKAKGVEASVVGDSGVAADGAIEVSGVEVLTNLVDQSKKDPAPEKVVFTTHSHEYVNAYWLHLLRMEVTQDKPVTIKGEINRATNEIHITTPPEVTEFRVYLNDEIVDMGKTIKLVHTIESEESPEAVVRFEGTKNRNLERSLTSWFLNLSGNYGEVYTNLIDVQVP